MTTHTAPSIRSILDNVREMAKWPHKHGNAAATHTIGGREVIVAYCAPSGEYEVGTEARVIAKGKRNVVAAAIAALAA